MTLLSMAVPLMICLVFTAAYIRRIDIAEVFCQGALNGLKKAAELAPTLFFVLLVVSFAYSSGAVDVLAELASPLLERLGFPQEILPLAAVRPLSGSAALAIFQDIMQTVPPDSFAGRNAAVLLGSTETTFYTIAVYYGAIHRKPDKRVFAASLTADMAAFLISSLTVRLFYGA